MKIINKYYEQLNEIVSKYIDKYLIDLLRKNIYYSCYLSIYQKNYLLNLIDYYERINKCKDLIDSIVKNLL